MLREHSPGRSTFLGELTLWPPFQKCDVNSKIQLRQAMRIYSRNNSGKFHPDTIRNDGALGFLKRLPQQEQEEQDE